MKNHVKERNVHITDWNIGFVKYASGIPKEYGLRERRCDMVQKIILKLLQLICIHDWIKGAVYNSYYDYSGYHVIQYRCHCQKCGKKKIRKYY